MVTGDEVSGRASPRVALATCAWFPDLPDDEPLLIAELGRRGVAAEPAVWDDPRVEWSAYELVIMRATWDYAPRRDAFLTWARSVPQLLNPSAVAEWNTDKRYLAGLPHAVSTQFVAPGGAWRAPDGEYVVKPSVSAASVDAARYRPGPGDLARAGAHIERLHAEGRTAMVQPFLGAVDHIGETALVFFAGRYSHAIRKGHMLTPDARPLDRPQMQEDIEPRVPTAEERAVAEDVLDALPWDRRELLYARVDLIPDGEGAPRLVELELTEPSLFLSRADGVAARLAERIVERL